MDHFDIKRTKNQTNKQTKTVRSQFQQQWSVTYLQQCWQNICSFELASLYTDVVLFFFLVVVLLAREWSERERKKNKKKTSFSCFQRCLQTFYFILPSPLPLALAVNKSPSVFTFITPVRRIIPWVPEVFLACGVNFRCLPKADKSSVVGRSQELDRNRKPR